MLLNVFVGGGSGRLQIEVPVDAIYDQLSVATEADLAAQPPAGSAEGLTAFVQANGGEYWAWYPTGSTLPAGTITSTLGNGGEWVFVRMATASVPATIVGGVTYAASKTDVAFELDSSNASQPAVDLWPTPYVGQMFSAAWTAGTVVLALINGNGNQISSYTSGTQVVGANTEINTPGGFGTWRYNGTLWRQVG